MVGMAPKRPISLDEPLKFSSSPKGLYLYGGVGCGKTTLMDLFHDACSLSRKKRVHFHEFMIDVHRRELCIIIILLLITFFCLLYSHEARYQIQVRSLIQAGMRTFPTSQVQG